MGASPDTKGEADFLNPIDPGAFLDPTDGRLWLTYGSYVGYLRLVELDPKTGKRVDRTFHNLAINCEASDMIYHDGWYYLLATHGSCCAGANSGYNIRVGRSRRACTVPTWTIWAWICSRAAASMLIGSGGRLIGPGHFGLMEFGRRRAEILLHWEADLDRGGASVLDIRPLLWKDGWPVAGENLKEGTYEIQSARTGTSLNWRWKECRLAAQRARGGGGGFGGRGGLAGRRGGRGAAGGAGETNAPGGQADSADPGEPTHPVAKWHSADSEEPTQRAAKRHSADPEEPTQPADEMHEAAAVADEACSAARVGWFRRRMSRRFRRIGPRAT